MRQIFLKVDKIQNNKGSGITSDFNKIKHNIEALGFDFESDVMIRLPFTDGFLNTVNTVGRYIMIMQIDKEFTKGKMMFFDHTFDVDLTNMIPLLSKIFSPTIADNFYKDFLSLRLGFRPELDLVFLSEE